MDRLIKNLRELSELLKAGNFVPPKVKPKALQTLPSIKQPKPPSLAAKKPQAPKLPGLKPGSIKDPKKIAEQLKNPGERAAKIKQADMLKVDAQGQWKIEKADTKPSITGSPTLKVTPQEEAHTHDVFNSVHGNHDALEGGFAPNPEQHKLIHGLDFRNQKSLKEAGSKEGVTKGAAWLQSPHHEHHVLVKPSSGFVSGVKGFSGPDSMNAPRREVLYHNLAHNLFGMGKYVPTTSAFGKMGDEWSAQKMVGGHHGVNKEETGKAVIASDKYRDALKHMHGNGELHKLALMNSIMGNHDRHSGNFLVDNKEPKLHMIDNGFAFDYGNSGTRFAPSYLLHSKNALGLDNKKLHPEAKKWLNSIDENKAKEMMKQHGYDENSMFTKGLLKRLGTVKDLANNDKYEDVPDLLMHSRRSTGPHRKKDEAA